MKHLPLTQEPLSESGFVIDEVAEANAKETDDDHEQDTFYRRPSLWSH